MRLAYMSSQNIVHISVDYLPVFYLNWVHYNMVSISQPIDVVHSATAIIDKNIALVKCRTLSDVQGTLPKKCL